MMRISDLTLILTVNLTLKSDSDNEESVTRDMTSISDLTMTMTEEANLTSRSDSDDEESSRGRRQSNVLTNFCWCRAPKLPRFCSTAEISVGFLAEKY